jgi:hypothetical protein
MINFLIPSFAQSRATPQRIYDEGYKDYSRRYGTNTKSSASQHGLDLVDKSDAIYMSNITAREHDDTSRASSQVAINGIHKRVEVETYVENADAEQDGVFDRSGRRWFDPRSSIAV